MRRLLPYIHPHRRVLALGVVLGLLGNASALAEPLAAREVIESLADDGRSSLEPILLLSALVLASGLLAGVQLWMLDRVAERIALGARVGWQAACCACAWASSTGSPLVTCCRAFTSDTTLLRAATTTGVVESFNGALALLGAIVLMGVLDWLLLVVTLGVLAVVAAGVLVVLPRIGRATVRAQAAVGVIGSTLERALGAIRRQGQRRRGARARGRDGGGHGRLRRGCLGWRATRRSSAWRRASRCSSRSSPCSASAARAWPPARSTSPR
jgi:ABC-type multidrug transport system fused ATPase/permease subunit